MTTELFKKTEETTMENGVEVKKVTALETVLKDEAGNEIGRINTNQWGGNFNIHTGGIDVEDISTKIFNILNNAE